MRLGMWTSYFIDLNPEDMVRQFADKGWYLLELSTEHAQALLERGNPGTVGKEFRDFANGLGVSFPQGHLWLQSNIASDNQQEQIDILKKWLDLFMAIGIEAAVLHPGGRGEILAEARKDELLERRVKALNELTAHCQGSGLTICLENIVSSAPEAEDLLNIIDHVHGELGICLDTGHLNITSKKFGEFIHKTKEYLKALHIADNDGSGDQHLMPYGRGNVNWEEVVSNLKAVNYQGLINLEIPGETRCPLPIRLAKLDFVGEMMRLMWEDN